jgi:hypothetical protein
MDVRASLPEDKELRSMRSQTAQAEAAQAKNNSVATPKPASETKPVALKPTSTGASLVYIQIREESQGSRVERLVQTLQNKGIQVSEIKTVDRGPETADLRFFRTWEREDTERVMRVLNELGIPVAHLKRIAGYEASAIPRQYELWLPPVAPRSGWRAGTLGARTANY